MNRYDLKIQDIIKKEGKIKRVDYKYVAHNELNQMAFIKGSRKITKKDKVTEDSLQEWLVKKIKTKGQKELKELLGQKTNAS